MKFKPLSRVNVVCDHGHEFGPQFFILTCYLGAKLINLLPYSPDFNPIEQAFHSIKSWL